MNRLKCQSTLSAVSRDQSLSYMYISQPDIKDVDVAQFVCSLQKILKIHVHLLNCRHVLFSLKPTEWRLRAYFIMTLYFICYSDAK